MLPIVELFNCHFSIFLFVWWGLLANSTHCTALFQIHVGSIVCDSDMDTDVSSVQ
jgi:hypothetical protein